MQAKWCLAQSGSQPLLESKLWLTPSLEAGTTDFASMLAAFLSAPP
jgi:hypothetical protein